MGTAVWSEALLHLLALVIRRKPSGVLETGGTPVIAADRYTLSRAPASSAVAAIVGGTDSVPPAPPLPTLKVLGAIPSAWHAKVPCRQPVADGCEKYDGTFRLTGTLQAAAQLWLATLYTSGYRIDHVVHRLVPAGERYTILAGRNLSAGGGRPLLAIASVTRRSDHGTIRARLYITPG